MDKWLWSCIKRPPMMTDTQVRYATNVENIRHNKQVEEENLRHNKQVEYQAALDLAEKARANRAAEANARYAADQSYAGNAVKAAATEYSARANERSARMKVTADAAQKEADRIKDQEIAAASRDLTKYIEDNKLEISRDSNQIKRDGNAITQAKNENDFEVAKDKLKQSAEDLQRKWAEYGLDLENYRLDRDKFNHTRVMDIWNGLNKSISTATKSAGELIDAVDKVKYGDTRMMVRIGEMIANLARVGGNGGANNG